MEMESPELLLEYLKEQYAQARQHETRQTNTTAFISAGAGALIGFAGKDGVLIQTAWWVGAALIYLGIVNFWINQAHQIGNRFHTKLAGLTRHALEDASTGWTVSKPTELRAKTLTEMGLRGPRISIGTIVYTRLCFVPLALIGIGIFILIHDLFFFTPP